MFDKRTDSQEQLGLRSTRMPGSPEGGDACIKKSRVGTHLFSLDAFSPWDPYDFFPPHLSSQPLGEGADKVLTAMEIVTGNTTFCYKP